MMYDKLKLFLFIISGNGLIQNMLEKLVFLCEYFMGMGSGSTTSSSGEKCVFNLLKGDTIIVFDVGANQGQFAREALDNVNATATIYSFEPSQSTYEMMKKNIKDKRHHTFNIGLGKSKSIMNLYYDDIGSGLASLTKRDLASHDIVFNKSEEVTIDTIDNFCEENKIEYIDLLKIDVEGHELDVLNGATSIFEKTKIVMFEFGGCNIDTRTYFKDFYKFFLEKDMILYRITPSGYLHRIEQYKELYEQFTTTNFVAKRENE